MDQLILPQVSDLKPLWPGAAVSFGLFGFGLLFARRGKRALAAIFAAFAMIAPFIVTFVVTKQFPEWPPHTSTQRMFFGLIGFAVACGIAECLRENPGPVRLLHFGVAGGLVLWLLKPFLALPVDAESHVAAETAFWLIGGVLLYGVLLEGTAKNVRGPAFPGLFCLAFGLAAQIFLLHNEAERAQLAGSTSMALGVAAMIVIAWPGRRFPTAAAVTLAGVVAAIGYDVHHFVVTPPPVLPMLILAAAPLAVLVTGLPGVRDWKPVPRFLLAFGLGLVALAVAGWLVFRPASDDGSSPPTSQNPADLMDQMYEDEGDEEDDDDEEDDPVTGYEDR